MNGITEYVESNEKVNIEGMEAKHAVPVLSVVQDACFYFDFLKYIQTNPTEM